MKNFTIVVLLSGNGSNLQAIIDRIHAENWPITIAAVISNNPNAYGLVRAQTATIPTHILTPKSFVDSHCYHEALQACIDAYHPDLIVLAGYMRILTPDFVNYYANKIINIHPSLLPKYQGLHTYERALAASETQHGISIHIVTPELDSGPILAQHVIDIAPNETVASLQAKIKTLEHQFYPEAIYRFLTEK